MSATNLPKHIAIILDGNKRWADKNKVSQLYGYKKGFDKIIEIVDFCESINIKYITLFTLSSENFKRKSIDIIYKIILDNFDNFINKIINEKKIKLKIFGNRENLPQKIKNIFEKSEKETKNNLNINLNLAFNYGFKDEIKNIIEKVQNNKEKIDIEKDDQIKKLFYLGDIPDPDILIRTGGYNRLSNFIMYNITYSELFFIKNLWPEFSVQDLNNIIDQFKNINRKYGL